MSSPLKRTYAIQSLGDCFEVMFPSESQNSLRKTESSLERITLEKLKTADAKDSVKTAPMQKAKQLYEKLMSQVSMNIGDKTGFTEEDKRAIKEIAPLIRGNLKRAAQEKNVALPSKKRIIRDFESMSTPTD